MTGWLLSALVAAFCCSQALAQPATPESNTDLSKETENPVTRHVTLPLRYEANFNDGHTVRPRTRTSSTRPCCR